MKYPFLDGASFLNNLTNSIEFAKSMSEDGVFPLEKFSPHHLILNSFWKDGALWLNKLFLPHRIWKNVSEDGYSHPTSFFSPHRLWNSFWKDGALQPNKLFSHHRIWKNVSEDGSSHPTSLFSPHRIWKNVSEDGYSHPTSSSRPIGYEKASERMDPGLWSPSRKDGPRLLIPTIWCILTASPDLIYRRKSIFTVIP